MSPILSLLLIPVVLAGSSGTNLIDQIESDLQSGKISQAEAIRYKLEALKAPEKLPWAYANLLPTFTRMGTAIIAEAQAALPGLSVEERQQIASLVIRPSEDDLPESLISPSGRFKLHYTLQGKDGSDPLFVAQVAEYFDYSYNIEVEQLGFAEPPSDGGVDGPEWDIYLHNISDYGYTTFESPIPETPWQDYSGFVEMDNDFSATPTKGLDGAKVTAAHELFHLIHLGYRSYNTPKLNSIFLYEAAASWMEDVVYDDVNDYYFYLNGFFSNYSKAFNTSDGNHEYGLGLFFHMLEKKYGTDCIKSIWEEFKSYETFEALERSFERYKSNLAIELTEFAIWNLFTGERADSVRFYPEGAHYPEIKVAVPQTFSSSITCSGENANVSPDYVLVSPQQSANYTIWPSFEDPFNWMFGAVTFPLDKQAYYLYSSGNIQKELQNVKSLADIWIIPINVTVPTSDFSSSKKSYQFQLEKGSAPQMENRIASVFPNPFRSGQDGALEIRFKLSEPANDVFLSILTEQGLTVYKKSIGRRPDGDNKFIWDGRSDDGSTLSSGIYLVLIQANRILKPGKFTVIN